MSNRGYPMMIWNSRMENVLQGPLSTEVCKVLL
jgi:hypothetical protein